MTNSAPAKPKRKPKAKPKARRKLMTPDDWAKVQEKWEGDSRLGYLWLVREMGLTVSTGTVSRRARIDGWVKSVEPDQTLRTVGRPGEYREEYAERARKLCLLLGATDDELAGYFEVHRDTIVKWKQDHAGFSDAIRSGKEEADAKVAERLYCRALGYSHPHVDVKVIENQIVLTELVKHYPPDTSAASLWLRNRQPTKWRDKIEVEQKTEMTIAKKEDLDAIYAEKMARMELGREQFSGREVVPVDEP